MAARKGGRKLATIDSYHTTCYMSTVKDFLKILIPLFTAVISMYAHYQDALADKDIEVKNISISLQDYAKLLSNKDCK